MASPAQRPCEVRRELEDAIAREDWAEVKSILSASSHHVADSVVTQLISKDQWSAVRQMIECVRDADRTWNIEGIVVKNNILLSVAENNWTCLKESPNERFPDKTFQWIIHQACTRADDLELIQFVLPDCAEDRLDSVLTILVERRLWEAVGEMLARGVSDARKQWAVREACEHCKKDSRRRLKSQSYRWYHPSVERFLLDNILPHCADDQPNSVLTTLVERRLWRAVGEVLKKGVSDSDKQWAVKEACTDCDDYDSRTLIETILPHCADNQLDSVLTTPVKRGLWQVVADVLNKGVSDSKRQWAVHEACEHCYKDFGINNSRRSLHSLVEQFLVQDILPHCADDQVDCVLTTLIHRRLWQAVAEVLKKGISDSKKQRAVKEACESFENADIFSFPRRRLINQFSSACKLPHCVDDQLITVLTTLVERRLWQAAGEVLDGGVSDDLKRWAVQEACKHCRQGDMLFRILLHCLDDNLYSALTILVEGHQWKAVGQLLQRDVNETQRSWTVEEASKSAKSDAFILYILPYCSDRYMEYVLPNLARQGELIAVDIMMQIHAKDMETESSVFPRWYVDVLPSFVEHRVWNHVQEMLHSVVMKSLCHWVTQGGEIKDDSVLWAIVNTCRVNATCAVQLFKAVKEKAASKVRELHECLGLTENMCELLYTSFLDQVCVALCSEEKKTDGVPDSIHNLLLEIYTGINSCIQTISTNSVEVMVGRFKSEGRNMTSSGKLSSISVHHFLHFLKLFNLYYTCKRQDDDDEVLLMMFTVLPLFPVLQSVALRIMLRHKRWDVISHADLSGVWEQDRRHLLQAAVKQRQWSVVKRWADHTLYDDQRVWALNEALNEKQWDVALLLADHGLTDIDLMRVHYWLAKYADWDVILHMFERGADVAEVRERLGRMKDNKRISENVHRCIIDRHSQVKTLETKIKTAKADAWVTACQRCNWIFVLYTLIRNPSKELVHCALKVAMKKRAWHVVMQLVRVGMDAKQRHSLFSRMMKRRQWGVCRVLLEQGLSVHLCLKVLPQLMEMNQWTLVARVMEHDVGDDVRQQVMQRAWERREGSVVWLCIKSLPTPLSVEEREALFQRAFACEMWQVIKPLVEEKDKIGIRHRDTALLEAIDKHEWDLGDHCQWHHADINMKDNIGHTPLQKQAMKKDWEAVEELVVRDGDANLLDSKGYTVLHRAIESEQWDTVYLLIQFQADIHKKRTLVNGGRGATPLGMLITARQGDIIEHTLLWCPGQSKGANNVGETTLHAVCLSGCYDSMYYLVARGVNPLAVTMTGQSALVYAVLNEDCPQRMVAECIRLGLSTHQPTRTNIEDDLKSVISYYRYDRDVWSPEQQVTSPVLCALLRGLPVVVVQMLYESGGCSQSELFKLYTELHKLADLTTVEGAELQQHAGHHVDAYTHLLSCIEDIALPYLTEIATTPRSLESTCRLVISDCLTLSKTRHRDVDQLPLTKRMKNFVLFSDLTDPDFGKDTT